MIVTRKFNLFSRAGQEYVFEMEFIMFIKLFHRVCFVDILPARPLGNDSGKDLFIIYRHIEHYLF